MKNKKYLKYHLGKSKFNGHIDAVHAHPRQSDQYTGEIVNAVINKMDCSGIIATISRTKMDLNRQRNKDNAPAIDEYRATIRDIIDSKRLLNRNDKLRKNYLHLAIHGMSNDRKNEFEIGTLNGNSCDSAVEDWFIQHLESITTKIGVNTIFPGDPSKSVHRSGDGTSNYRGYGNHFHTIQIEINRTWRRDKQADIVNFLCLIINSFDKRFNPL